jgi:hypothetical protein
LHGAELECGLLQRSAKVLLEAAQHSRERTAAVVEEEGGNLEADQ